MTTMSAEFALFPAEITLCLALVIRRSKCGKLLQGIVLKPITGIGIGFEWFEFFLLSVETQVIANLLSIIINELVEIEKNIQENLNAPIREPCQYFQVVQVNI